ncbi:MAG: hypothetical protein A2Y12_09265 [Planctomycetes bacterium GWF2_42_9]|nr:MAG: hypothetical protein A2Y12_09265 [Planctomycetes bacterium GWF2_42_9]
MMIKPEHGNYIKNGLNNVQCRLNQESIIAFARKYLRDHFPLPPCSMHREISEILKEATRTRRNRIALAAPRLYNQSELVDIAYILWSICYQKESLIVLVGDTQEQASEQLAIVKDSLETNPDLLRDFPNATGKTKSWQATYFTSRNGIKVSAAGLNQEPHPFTFRGKKPSLVIFDLLQVHLHDMERRSKTDMRYLSHIQSNSCGDETNIIVVGTIMHQKSILATLLDDRRSVWICKKYQAIISEAEDKERWKIWQSIFDCETDYQGESGAPVAEIYFKDNKEAMLKGAKVLWPECETYDKLMNIKASMMNNKLFNCEKQNMPPGIDYIKRERMRAQLLAMEREFAEEDKRNAAKTSSPPT